MVLIVNVKTMTIENQQKSPNVYLHPRKNKLRKNSDTTKFLLRRL